MNAVYFVLLLPLIGFSILLLGGKALRDPTPGWIATLATGGTPGHHAAGPRAREHDGRAAAAVLGLEPAEPVRVVPYAGARDHTLHAFCKIAPTPERFPRRAGMAVKRPLSAVG